MSVSTMSELTRPAAAAEFSITRPWQSDRRGPVRWILSHVLRHKIYIAGVFVGALGNALGAGAIALYIGQAFEVMTHSADFRALGWIAFELIISQIIRGVLMLGRNFCSEVIGQRV